MVNLVFPISNIVGAGNGCCGSILLGQNFIVYSGRRKIEHQNVNGCVKAKYSRPVDIHKYFSFENCASKISLRCAFLYVMWLRTFEALLCCYCQAPGPIFLNFDTEYWG